MGAGSFTFKEGATGTPDPKAEGQLRLDHSLEATQLS